ncbi:hypothetical protein [Absidia glauca]|uniref:Uncharacterized protein n=1 Tax=Absidia glauca TaxID=4829 RepID=A0A168RP31_ABSGL|nr:hypothetical protein [Absidia glauca]
MQGLDSNNFFGRTFELLQFHDGKSEKGGKRKRYQEFRLLEVKKKHSNSALRKMSNSAEALSAASNLFLVDSQEGEGGVKGKEVSMCKEVSYWLERIRSDPVTMGAHTIKLLF